MTRRWTVRALTLALLLSGFAAGCGESSDDGQAASSGSPAKTETLRAITFPGTLLNLPYDVAREQGLLERNAVEVREVTVPGSGAAVMATLASGGADLALVAMSNALVQRDRGVDVAAVTGVFGANPLSVVVREDAPSAHADAGYPEVLKDLKGLKLGVTGRGDTSDNMLRLMLEAAGLDPERDVTILPVGFPDTALPALKQGRIDAYTSFEPMTTRVVHEGIGRVLVDLARGDVRELAWEYQQWGALAETVTEKKAAMDGFRAAMADAFAYIADPANRERIVDLVAEKVAGGDRELARKLVENNLQYFGPDVGPESVEKASAFLVDFGLIKRPVAPDDYIVR